MPAVSQISIVIDLAINRCLCLQNHFSFYPYLLRNKLFQLLPVWLLQWSSQISWFDPNKTRHSSDHEGMRTQIHFRTGNLSSMQFSSSRWGEFHQNQRLSCQFKIKDVKDGSLQDFTSLKILSLSWVLLWIILWFNILYLLLFDLPILFIKNGSSSSNKSWEFQLKVFNINNINYIYIYIFVCVPVCVGVWISCFRL